MIYHALFRLAVVLIIAGMVSITRPLAAPVDARIVKVVDGDTIRVRSVTFRLVGFDTPETSRVRCATERQMGNQTTRRLRQLVAGGGLDLTRLPCACRPGTEGTRRCNFGRLCGVLKARGRDVGAILIAEKLARPYVCSGSSCPSRGQWCTSTGHP